RAAAKTRALRAGRGRNAFSRRDRRHAARAADAPFARALRRQLLSRRRPPADQGQRARDRRHAPEPRAARARGNVPRGSLSPPERDPPAAAEPARALRGCALIDPAFPVDEREATRCRTETSFGRRARARRTPRVSGEREAARKPVPLAHGDGAGTGDRYPGSAGGVPRP